MTKQIKTATACGPKVKRSGLVSVTPMRARPKGTLVPVVIVHGLTEAGVHEAAALRDACRELGIETVEQLKARLAPDPRVAELSGYITVLLDLATDAANGLEYVRDVHGDLYGVGFDRVKIKAEVLPVIRLKMSQLISAQRGEEQK